MPDVTVSYGKFLEKYPDPKLTVLEAQDKNGIDKS